jgi:hypothetical protein
MNELAIGLSLCTLICLCWQSYWRGYYEQKCKTLLKHIGEDSDTIF